MSLEAWIIDEIEREQPAEQERRPRPELGIAPAEDCGERVHGEPSERGVKIVDISPTHENVIDL